ncbi:hypothetical protein CKAH01_01757 [Colletotrichum kahawae]|uniref:Uncharacterized protein n=1 Tax=Colletotrichum kahawae TaxID=34407 RepID=A0AAE0D2E9_COLKA|nr:hypothetical protein CKAH01_01757 [Colletotrichum kahawae]
MSANDSKKYRRERNVSFEPVHSVSVRGHRHQASDSGVGSDQDSYSTSPDRSAQAYFDLHKAHLSLKDECTKLKEELRDVNARFSALQNTVEVLEDDKEKLVREKRTLREENDKLKEDARKARSSQPRERERDLPKMTGAMPVQQPPSPKEKTRRGESKVRRSESKRRTSDDEKRHEEKREKRNEEKERKERKEREKLHEEDKKRLKSRFDHKDGSSKDDGSVSSGSSGRKSYVEPYGPSAPRSTAERPRKSRADSTYSQIRPQVIATTTIPDYEGSAAVYDDGYAGEDGHYPAYPPASPLPAESRGRSRQW